MAQFTSPLMDVKLTHLIKRLQISLNQNPHKCILCKGHHTIQASQTLLHLLSQVLSQPETKLDNI